MVQLIKEYWGSILIVLIFLGFIYLQGVIKEVPCDEGVATQKAVRQVQVDSLLTKNKIFYTIECKSGHTKEVQVDKQLPLGIQLEETWRVNE